jgi:L-serine dehydratase
MEKISVFDIFKIGIGPSSSHTVGPWRAAQSFLQNFILENKLTDIQELTIELFGSLAKTGKGHGTDIALMMGLTGADLTTFETANISSTISSITESKSLLLNGDEKIAFEPTKNIILNVDTLRTEHANTMDFTIVLKSGEVYSLTYLSLGGGFILNTASEEYQPDKKALPFPVNKAVDMLDWHEQEDKDIVEISLQNELHWRTLNEIDTELDAIWQIMLKSVYDGCHTDGILPGGLEVVRRAAKMNRRLLPKTYHDQDEWLNLVMQQSRNMDNVTSWVSCFALAVNEVNASFGRIVTAPTNGSAGVIPAVMLYLYCFHDDITQKDLRDFLLVAGEVGSIFKKGATISAAAGGCQAEIGVSSAMAAAALTFCLGGNTRQSLMAAEIAMEHHLGLTCDPVGGLVQIPCIERNTMGAIKAITATQLALHSDPENAKVSLDDVVATMWQTAQDMKDKYKETSEGGLAIQVRWTEC